MGLCARLVWLVVVVGCDGGASTSRLDIEALTAPEQSACLDLRARLKRGFSRGECGIDRARLPHCESAGTDKTLAVQADLIYAGLAAKIDACTAQGNVSKRRKVDLLQLIYDLAGFCAHVGHRSRYDDVLQLYWKAGDALKGLLGRHIPRRPISDLRGLGPCPRSKAVIEEATGLYLAQGFQVISMHELAGTYLYTARGLRVLPETARRVSCHDYAAARRRRSGMLGPSQTVCSCLHPGQFLYSGWGIMDADVELFVNLRGVLARQARAFAIGNAFGFSSVVLGLLFARTHEGDGFVDAIDAETEAGCNHVGSLITRTVANASGLNVALSVGMSPRDVPYVMRAPAYDLAFIDGEHTRRQVLLDFAAVEPRMAPRSLMVLHDVGAFDLHEAVDSLPSEWQRQPVRGRFYKNLVGTVLLHRGFPAGTFDGF